MTAARVRLGTGVAPATPPAGILEVYAGTDKRLHTKDDVGVDIALKPTAPPDADYLVGTANPDLSAEIVVGPTPGGELGGTWSFPTVDAVHSGSAHHSQSHSASDHVGDIIPNANQDLGAFFLDASEIAAPAAPAANAVRVYAKDKAGVSELFYKNDAGTERDLSDSTGDSVRVNGVAVTDANFNDTTPAASAGRKLLLWQRSGAGPDAVSVQTPADVPIVLFREPTLISIAASVAETNIFNQTIPANAMGTNRMLRLMIIGARLNNSGLAEATPTFRVYTGGVERYDDPVVPMNSMAEWSPVAFHLLFGMQNSATVMYFGGWASPTGEQGGAATGIGSFEPGGGIAGKETFVIGSVAGATFAQDTTVNWVLRVTWQNGTNNANVIFRRQYATLELL